MARFPRLKGKELVRLLEKIGFEVVRTRGSHGFLRPADVRATTVSVHSGETIGPVLSGRSSTISSCRWRICLLVAEPFVVLTLLLVLVACQTAKVHERQQEATDNPAPTKAETSNRSNPPPPPVTPQSIVKGLFPNAREKAQTAECFRSLTPENVNE